MWNQFGFRNGIRAGFSETNLYLIYIDYNKIFDKVQHAELMKSLTSICGNDADLRILQKSACSSTDRETIN